MDAASPRSGLFSSSSEPLGADELDLALYDRLPRQDHADVELPGKVRLHCFDCLLCCDNRNPSQIEWFACPEGTKTIVSEKRPEPYFSSFVLSAGGDADEHYGEFEYFSRFTKWCNMITTVQDCQ